MKAGISILDAAELFIEDMSSRQLAASTVPGRASWTRRFARSAVATYRDRTGSRKAVCRTAELDPSYVAKFLKDGDYKQGNYNNALKALRAFFRYLERMRYIEKEGADWLMGDRKGKAPERMPKQYIPDSEFPRMLDLAEDWHGSDRAIMAIALYTLCRQSEIRDLRLKDVDLEERTLMVRRSKRRRWTEVGINPVLFVELQRWLAWYAHEMEFASVAGMVAEHPDWRLIPRRLYRPNQRANGRFYRSEGRFTIRPDMPSSHLEKVMKRVLVKLGVSDGRHSEHTDYIGEGLHTVRRSGARALYLRLADSRGRDEALIFVSTLLDHESLEQTMVYIGIDEERRRLNDWLRENSMYGEDPNPTAATVTALPVRTALRAVAAIVEEAVGSGEGTSVQAL